MFSAFPNELREDLEAVLKRLPNRTFNDVNIINSEAVISYVLGNGIVEIPYRMYLVDIADATYEMFSTTQKQILCCIYTRSCNGYIREKYLRKLLEMSFDEWAIPYIVKLCDEYVLEMIELIYNKLKKRNNCDIQGFCLRNKTVIRKSYSRMSSYWNEYYREQEDEFRKYIGRILFRECFGYNRSFEK